ncbi:MAG TPA: hypothetical protein VN476_18330 [Pyrinomonadaceae bacterium]|nr:hypothetical protein [Pyrinomonadaceae bacterium]
MKTDPGPVSIEERHRTLLILWFAICMSLTIMYFAFIYLATVTPAPNPKLTLLLNTVGLIPVAASFLIKQILLEKAVTAQQMQQVHSAYVISFALCEVSGLLALLDYRLTGSKYYYLGFAIGGIGLLLHFPRKQHLVDASSPRI